MTRRAWGKKAWVTQINAASSAVARSENRQAHGVNLDLELMAAAFTPSQSSVDDIHFKGWLAMELLNIDLNLAI